jgi:hypothetical protein
MDARWVGMAAIALTAALLGPILGTGESLRRAGSAAGRRFIYRTSIGWTLLLVAGIGLCLALPAAWRPAGLLVVILGNAWMIRRVNQRPSRLSPSASPSASPTIPPSDTPPV